MVLAAVLTPASCSPRSPACAPAPATADLHRPRDRGGDRRRLGDPGTAQHAWSRGCSRRARSPSSRPSCSGCASMADLPRPDLAVDQESQPNSWVVDAPGARRACTSPAACSACSTRRARGRAGPRAQPHRPSRRDRDDGRRVARRRAAPGRRAGRRLVGLVAGADRAPRRPWRSARSRAIGTNALSRYRELIADAGAVDADRAAERAGLRADEGVGRPRAHPGLGSARRRARDAFHLLPSAPSATGWTRAPARRRTRPSSSGSPPSRASSPAPARRRAA